MITLGVRVSIYLEDELLGDVRAAFKAFKLPSVGAFVKKSVQDEVMAWRLRKWKVEMEERARSTTAELRKRGTSKFDAAKLVRSIRDEDW